MGGDLSLPLPEPSSKDHCCISTYYSDSLCLIYLDKVAVDTVRNAVLTNWPQGISEEKYLCAGDNQNAQATSNCLKIKVRGKPFQPLRGKNESVNSRLMIAAILNNMLDHGWKCVLSSDLSQTSDRGTWFFQKQPFVVNHSPIFSVGLSSTDKLQINDCPDHLHNTIRTVCAQFWCNGIQAEDRQGRTYEIKLNGNPWSSSNKSESCSARLLIKEMIQKLTSVQHDLYCTSNINGMSDTLFFQQNKQIQCELVFCAVSLTSTDRMRLLDMPEPVCQTVKQTVSQCWSGGIQDTTIHGNCFEMKLKGTPWCTKGQEGIHSRRLISKVLETLATCGWYCMTGIELSRNANDKSTLLFRKGSPLVTRFTCISLSETDKVHFIDAPADVVSVGRSVVERWPMGLSEQPIHYQGVTYQAKLKGTPWSEIGKGDGIYGRALMLGLWHSLHQLGWRLILSADVSSEFIYQDSGPDWPVDVHSWWFMYDHTLLSQ